MPGPLLWGEGDGGRFEEQPAWMFCEDTPLGLKCINGTGRRTQAVPVEGEAPLFC